MLDRIANWPIALNDEIDRWRNRPFEWGTADCCQFPAAVVRAITGRDLLPLFGNYANEDAATALLTEHGGLVGLITHALGDPKPVSWAHRGDVLAAELANGMTAAICVGVHACAMDRKGLVFFPTARAACAWSV